MKKYLIVISGATATGKTAMAIKIARALQCPILSCDSRQFYKELNIGTAKADAEEQRMAKHYFINSLSIQDNYSVGDFEKDGLELLKNLYSQHQYAILVGGSGLFIKAICEGLDHFPPVSEAIKQDLIHFHETQGIAALQEELQAKDPKYAEQVDLNNHHRLIRALGIIRAHGKPFSTYRTGQKASRSFHPIYINLHMERVQLYDRINQRVDLMMEKGLLEEVESLLPYQTLNALQTVGYQELFDYFNQKQSLKTAIELIKRNSRRYAKRQITWFRRAAYWKHFAPIEQDLVLNYIQWKTEQNIHILSFTEENQADYINFFQSHYPATEIPTAKQNHILLAYKAGRLIAICYCKKSKKVPPTRLVLCVSEQQNNQDLKDFLIHEMKYFA